MTPQEQHIIGAQMAAKLAAEYRHDAFQNNLTADQRMKMLREAEKCDERAAWYREVAGRFNSEAIQ